MIALINGEMVIMVNQITDMFGLKIYTERSVYVGEVEDVIIDVDNKRIEAIAAGKVSPELIDVKNHKGVKLPYRMIRSIGDVVVIRHLPAAFRTTPE